MWHVLANICIEIPKQSGECACIFFFYSTAEYIKPCAKDDAALNECAKQNGQEAIASIVEGNKSV